MEHCRIEMVPLLALSNLSASGRQDFVSICSVKWLPYTATKKKHIRGRSQGAQSSSFFLKQLHFAANDCSIQTSSPALL